ncbi:two pore domain potassium channel family protein [Sphingomonas sp. HDW15A]|uniref:ion channel n=1 Tax=Sphingomonas sp. HDW15A TaxID=2714942 RepID=UPI00140914F2|nr:ion channel [Sphingomonas sp. HDW15A]QIK96920.1 two pore domain potassium channel family protein [Sphingomonas sp. HDW15A]
MIGQLLVGLTLIAMTVVIHGSGLMLLSRWRKVDNVDPNAVSPTDLLDLGHALITVLALFALHALEIWLYAAFYALMDIMPDFYDALYFSTMTYSTLGFDDSGLDYQWRLVAAIESINGLILVGWSTAYFVGAVGAKRR